MKYVLVTGAAGLIGSRLCEKLSSKDYFIVALDRHDTPPLGLPYNTWVARDLAEPLDHSVLPERVDVIVHLAQSLRFREFPDGARDVFAVNTMSTLDLLEYGRKAGTRQFILASSGGVYGSGDRPFSETDTVIPSESYSVYQTSKLAAELLVDAYSQFFVAAKLRFFFVYGPGQHDDMLIPRIAGFVAGGSPVHLDGEEGMKINPVYVDDAAAAVERAIESDAGGTFNIGGREVLSIRRIGEILGELFGKRPVFEHQPDAHPRNLVGDITKMSMQLIAPRISFRTGIEKTFTSLMKG